MDEAERFSAIGVKFGVVIANIASILSLGLSISDRTPSLATKSGSEALSVVLHLTLLVAILYGVLWAIAERVWGWKFGAGGSGKMPAGWSAVALSISLTLPLGVVPFVYQRVTGIGVVHPAHWKAMSFVLLLGAGIHLLIYGTRSGVPNGLREKILPQGKHVPYTNSVLMEVVYGICFFGLVVVPYRLIANPTAPLRDLILGRAALPCFAFVVGMAFFIFIKYPDAMDDPQWIQIRGLIGGLLTAFCLCGGMFL